MYKYSCYLRVDDLSENEIDEIITYLQKNKRILLNGYERDFDCIRVSDVVDIYHNVFEHGITKTKESIIKSQTKKDKCLDLSYGEMINCGTNINLFKAVEAIRDDSDINQWFTIDEDCMYSPNDNPQDEKYWYLCSVDDYRYSDGLSYDQGWHEWHKATLEELKKHFNN